MSSSIQPRPMSSQSLTRDPRRRSSSILNETTTMDHERTLKSARPLRRSSFARRNDKVAPVSVFEDVPEDQELQIPTDHRASGPRILGGQTLLSKPAQKMQMRRISTVSEQEESDITLSDVISRTRKRTSILPDALVYENPVAASHSKPASEELMAAKANVLKKNPRRRTIFVPSDDTTIMTIHPGAYTTDRIDDTFQLHRSLAVNPLSTKVDNKDAAKLNALEKMPRKARMSLVAAPRRMPLQPATVSSNSTGVMDIDGKNGGKENRAPGPRRLSSQVKPLKESQMEAQPSKPRPGHLTSTCSTSTTASLNRQSVHTRPAVPLPSDASHHRMRKRAAAQPTHCRPFVRQKTIKERADDVHEHESSIRKQCVQPKREQHQDPSASMYRRIAKSTKLTQYPVLAENVSQPELYEENWLTHQEVALSELINQIFVKSKEQSTITISDSGCLRKQMLQLYHKESVKIMHQRVQASLLYGNLSRPKGLQRMQDLKRDLGLRRKFLSLWINNYDETALLAAAEVIVGRQSVLAEVHGSVHLEDTESLLDPRAKRKAIIGFLETFFVNVDDDPDEMKSQDIDLEHKWGKSVLRSVMLIWLLDQSKQSGAIRGCLFQRKAEKKSSILILLTLSSMLVSTAGDIMKALQHFEYTLHHRQDPLDEVDYSIQNMAVDLRDGVLLTRLTEVLVLDAKRPVLDDEQDTLVVRMPDLTVVESNLHQSNGSWNPRPLSQHLKMPCLGRAQKLFNVQLAMSALDAHDGPARNALCTTTAEDVVDGHREKTLSLVWSLVSSKGLHYLLDWNVLARDINHTRGSAAMPPPRYTHIAPSTDDDEALLLEWAAAHSSRVGVAVSNLTTSFADGRAYAAILQSFACYVTSETNTTQTSNPKTLKFGLEELGCSSAFIKQLVASSESHAVPVKATTISNLAFLASHLLPRARQWHAAATIQRAFRRYRFRLISHRRNVLKNLAHECATVVQMQGRLRDAAVVIQHAWRGVVKARAAEMNANVLVFQSITRRWLCCRRLNLTQDRIARSRVMESL